MAKMIQDGFAFMEYVNAGLIRRVDDIPELKHTLIASSEEKTHRQLSQYALLLAEHILQVSGVARGPEIEACFTANRCWQAGQAHFQQGRDAAGALHDLARQEKDPVKTKVLRAMGQVAATPHVRWHALAASEYAVVICNLLYPKDMDRVWQERTLQIEMMTGV